MKNKNLKVFVLSFFINLLISFLFAFKFGNLGPLLAIAITLFILIIFRKKINCKKTIIKALIISNILLYIILFAFGFMFASNMMNQTLKRACCIEANGIFRDNKCVQYENLDFDYKIYEECIHQ